MDESDFFDHNGFKIIDDGIITGAQSFAEEIFIQSDFKTQKSNCVIVFKENDKMIANLKRDYQSALKKAKELMEYEINSIIFIFTNYPKTVKHHIVSENPLSDIPDYEGKGNISIVDVTNL